MPCETNFGNCVTGLANVFVSAGGNLRALLNCDKNAVAADLAPRIACAGTKPTAAQLAAQLRG